MEDQGFECGLTVSRLPDVTTGRLNHHTADASLGGYGIVKSQIGKSHFYFARNFKQGEMSPPGVTSSSR